MSDFTEAQVVAQLKAARDRAGGLRAFAKLVGVSPSYASDVLLGRRAPGPDFLKALGLRKVVTVRYTNEPKDER